MAATTAPPPRPATAARRTGPGFVLLGSIQVTLIFTLMAISVPLPRIGVEFGLDRSGLVLLSSAYGLSFAGLLLLGGRLTVRYGSRRMLMAGLVFFAISSVAVPLASGWTLLVGLRFAQGSGAALTAPAAMGALRVLLPAPVAYGRAMATWGGLSVLGATAGNLLSGVVSAYVSWRWMFAVPVMVAAAALALAPRLLPADLPRTPIPALDLRGAVLATAGVALADYAVVQTGARGWSSTAVLAPLLIAIALLMVFSRHERRVPEPLLPPTLLRDGRRALGLAAVALTAAGTALTFFLLPLNFQQERGWSPLRTSAAFVPYAVALLAGGRVAGPFIAQIGAALSFAGAMNLAIEGIPPHQTGLAGGVTNTAMELGPTVGLAVLLSLGSPTTALAAAGGCLAATAAAAVAIRRFRCPPATTHDR